MIIDFIRNRPLLVSLFFVVIYTVGVVGLIVPFTKSLLVELTFLVLLITSIALFVFHRSIKPKRDLAVFAIIFLSGIVVEIVGVKTGLIFGSYHYGNSLGPKILGTPIIIGLNWLFLTYAAASISEKISSKTAIQILATPTIMLIYDLVLEQLAQKMDMWYWENSVIPIQNYIAWWVLGFLFAALLKTFKVSTKNPVAPVLITVQFLFFVILFLFHNFVF